MPVDITAKTLAAEPTAWGVAASVGVASIANFAWALLLPCRKSERPPAVIPIL
jgi:hypothetical protein